MLSRKDKEMIREIVKEEIRREFKAALFREITIERNIPDKKGDVPGRIETGTANLLDMLVIDIPRLVQSVAGAEEASNQARNRSIEALEKVEVLGSTIAAISNSIRIMARFSLMLEDSGIMTRLVEHSARDAKAIESGE